MSTRTSTELASLYHDAEAHHASRNAGQAAHPDGTACGVGWQQDTVAGELYRQLNRGEIELSGIWSEVPTSTRRKSQRQKQSFPETRRRPKSLTSPLRVLRAAVFDRFGDVGSFSSLQRVAFAARPARILNGSLLHPEKGRESTPFSTAACNPVLCRLLEKLAELRILMPEEGWSLEAAWSGSCRWDGRNSGH